jgi:hypothetical protein
MKTLLLLIALSLSAYTDAQTASESDSTTTWTSYSGIFLGEDVIPYMVGSYNMPGYELETRVCSNDESVTLSNGRRIAGLSCILFDAPDYIGGEMVFGGDTTVVTNIVCTPVADGALFTVTGEEFNMSFTLTTGIILKYESNYVIFNTEDRGVWTIHKKV